MKWEAKRSIRITQKHKKVGLGDNNTVYNLDSSGEERDEGNVNPNIIQTGAVMTDKDMAEVFSEVDGRRTLRK